MPESRLQGVALQDGVVTAPSDPAMLTLHAVRLLGFADAPKVAARFGLGPAETEEWLLDFEAYGWVQRSSFGETTGWSLTDSGRRENESRLAAELDEIGARPVLTDVHERFVPLNGRFLEAMTRWQTRPLPGNAMAANDHTDFGWDDRVFTTLASLGRRLEPLNAALADVLDRFDGYVERYERALARTENGEYHWADGISVDSCHTVWMQLHEDLIASLGLVRGSQP